MCKTYFRFIYDKYGLVWDVEFWNVEFYDANEWEFSKPERISGCKRKQSGSEHERKYNWLTFDGIYDWPFRDGSPARKFFKRQTSKQSRVSARREIQDQLDQEFDDLPDFIYHQNTNLEAEIWDNWQNRSERFWHDYYYYDWEDLKRDQELEAFWDEQQFQTPLDPLDEIYLDI